MVGGYEGSSNLHKKGTDEAFVFGFPESLYEARGKYNEDSIVLIFY